MSKQTDLFSHPERNWALGRLGTSYTQYPYVYDIISYRLLKQNFDPELFEAGSYITAYHISTIAEKPIKIFNGKIVPFSINETIFDRGTVRKGYKEFGLSAELEERSIKFSYMIGSDGKSKQYSQGLLLNEMIIHHAKNQKEQIIYLKILFDDGSVGWI